MNWFNLKKNRCPQCNKDVVKNPFNYVPYTKTLEHKCGFRISEQRFNEIVMSMNEEDLKAKHIEHGE